MQKKIVMGPYFKFAEEDIWMSTDKCIEGTVRVIEDQLCYAVPGICYLDEEEYDVYKDVKKDTLDVIHWEPFDYSPQ